MKDNSKSGKRLVVIGGGAAGFFCAVNAARLAPSLQVVLLEKSSKLLSKVKISGGGRCNVTHACFDIAAMSRCYPRGQHFVKKAFHHFFTTDTIAWFRERGVALKEEPDGRMFPVSDSSQTIIDCLLKEAAAYQVSIRMNTEVKGISQNNNRFHLQLGNEEILSADFVCIACGGYPKSSMFDWIRQTGHAIAPPVPSLFTLNLPGHPITKLMGISTEKAKVRMLSTRLEEEGPLLITHWGLSGPVILRISAWGARELAEKHWTGTVQVNWLPGYHEQSLKEKFRRLRFELAGQKLNNRNPWALPARLWEFILQQSGIAIDTRWADLPAAAENKLIKNLCAFEAPVQGKTTFKEEFVTAGGIVLSEIDPATMMSRKLPGLYFAGEIMDVDGITGGYNFQHAWTSGFVAATAVSKRNLATGCGLPGAG